MAKIQVQVTVESSSYDLGRQAGKLAAAVLAKKPWAEILAGEMIEIQNIAKDISEVKADMAEDKVAFYEGMVLGLKEGLFPAAPVA